MKLPKANRSDLDRIGRIMGVRRRFWGLEPNCLYRWRIRRIALAELDWSIMGKGIHRQGDMTTGHGGWLPTQPAAASTDVLINGKGAVRAGDAIVPHTNPSIPETHGGTYAGSSTVFVNGKPIQTIGSSVSCGDKAATGSGDVFAG